MKKHIDKIYHAGALKEFRDWKSYAGQICTTSSPPFWVE